jgi:MoaD family protein
MKINFYSAFREYAGIKSIELKVSESENVHSIIVRILADYPELRRLWLSADGNLYSHVQISLNQVDIMTYPDRLDTLIKERDVLDFFPPITGG